MYQISGCFNSREPPTYLLLIHFSTVSPKNLTLGITMISLREFAREVRRRGIQTPMLALTSLSGIEYEVKAKDCGYDSYEVKLDHDRLVRKVGNLLAAQEVSR